MMSSSPAEAPSRRLVNGRIALAFAADAEGRTYIARQHATYPFHICRPHYHDPDLASLATLYLQSCSGGLYEDDRLDIAIAMRAGSQAHVTTQASTVVHSMPEGFASQHVRIEAEAGSLLEYLADPQILFPGSRSASIVHVTAARGAIVLASDACLAHDPEGGGRLFETYRSEFVIADEAGRPLAIDRLRLDGASLAKRRVGVLGRFAAQGSLVVVLPGEPRETIYAALQVAAIGPEAADIGVSRLPSEAGLIVRIAASDGAALREAMHRAWSAIRLALKGAPPVMRRK